MKKIGIKIWTNNKSWAIIPNMNIYFFEGYEQLYGKYRPNEYVLAFAFLNLNIEIWTNKFWKGLFKINHVN